MKLIKIYFDAFRSLLNKEIELKHNCIGFVGTNESGKSNILMAIDVLGGNRKLTQKDTPKMSKQTPPTLKFLFNPNEADKKEILNILKIWSERNTLINNDLNLTNFNILYKITFNKQNQSSLSSFTFENIEGINNNYLILKHDYYKSICKIKVKDSFIPLNKAVIVKKQDIELSEKNYKKLVDDIKKINEDIINLKKNIETNNNIIKENEQIQENTKASPNKNPTSEKDILILQKLEEKKEKLESEIKDFNIDILEKTISTEIDELNNKITAVTKKITETQANIKKFDNKELTDPNQKRVLTTSKNNLAKYREESSSLEKLLKTKENELKQIRMPLSDKYFNDFSELNKYLGEIMLDKITGLLPKVVFWKHSNNYIIQSETLFDELLSKNSLSDISRPLVNIFRIGLSINNIDDLKSWITEIRSDSNERSKKERKLNTEVNRYIKSVWADYDQEIKISLEKDQIRIEIYDPNYEDRSYYNMEDRSQGAQTFLSFLLTIGAEAKKGVLKGNILLLDEPETHLHPSGVRFMLKELLKISENDNIVMYATHSIFMIDRDNFERHIILEKKNEQTFIKPSEIDRIGFFMQEEVLFKTLDIDLRKDFTSSKRYNFVFEGYGDAIIFECFYSKLKKGNFPFPLKYTSFHQGGKCSNIQKYFSQNPIQLGTKWVFIIDKDGPGNGLKKFIEGKYRDYLEKDIYIFQYESDKAKDTENSIELEDLLPFSIIKESYLEAFKSLKINIESKIIEDILKNNKLYNEYNNKILKLIEEESAFKEKFKEMLNSKIKNSIKEIKDEDSFKNNFEDFYNWATNVVAELKKAQGTTKAIPNKGDISKKEDVTKNKN